MEKKLVYHRNKMGHEINESMEYYAEDVFDEEIYCRRSHEIKVPKRKECWECLL